LRDRYLPFVAAKKIGIYGKKGRKEGRENRQKRRERRCGKIEIDRGSGKFETEAKRIGIKTGRNKAKTRVLMSFQ
jgi:hypothetical protein